MRQVGPGPSARQVRTGTPRALDGDYGRPRVRWGRRQSARHTARPTRPQPHAHPPRPATQLPSRPSMNPPPPGRPPPPPARGLRDHPSPARRLRRPPSGLFLPRPGASGTTPPARAPARACPRPPGVRPLLPFCSGSGPSSVAFLIFLERTRFNFASFSSR